VRNYNIDVTLLLVFTGIIFTKF